MGIKFVDPQDLAARKELVLHLNISPYNEPDPCPPGTSANYPGAGLKPLGAGLG